MADGVKLITVDEWRARFSKPPSRHAVWRWIKTGKIAPMPVKHGRQYYFTEDAHYEEPMNEPILVWAYHKAPEELRISVNGGDEDWLAEIPPEYEPTWIHWLDEPVFGRCRVDELDHPTKPGWKIRIGCHA